MFVGIDSGFDYALVLISVFKGIIKNGSPIDIWRIIWGCYIKLRR